jgi:hypothetical protein
MELNLDNGVLARVRGEEIGAASQTLPRPGPDQPKHMTVDIDTVNAGRVRLTFHLSSYKRPRKQQFWYWLAKRADPLD